MGSGFVLFFFLEPKTNTINCIIALLVKLSETIVSHFVVLPYYLCFSIKSSRMLDYIDIYVSVSFRDKNRCRTAQFNWNVMCVGCTLASHGDIVCNLFKFLFVCVCVVCLWARVKYDILFKSIIGTKKRDEAQTRSIFSFCMLI